MSSFINSAKHFSTIKKNLYRHLFNVEDKIYLPYSFADRFKKVYDRSNFIEVRENAVKEQINNFAKLQALCVNLQYKHHSENLDLDIKESQKEVVKDIEAKSIDKTALVKLLGCSIYQVETEHLKELRELTKEEEDALFFVKEIHKEIIEHIVYTSKEYNNSEYAI